jgi:hypothetical protein
VDDPVGAILRTGWLELSGGCYLPPAAADGTRAARFPAGR